MTKTIFGALFFLCTPMYCLGGEIESANYLVPSSGDATVPAATYDLDAFNTVNLAANSAVITFSLPEDLVGPSYPPIVLTQVEATLPDRLHFVGNRVSAQCTVQTNSSERISCKLSYLPSYIQTDPAAVAAFLNNKYLNNPAVLADKLSASASFKTDPEGVLTY